ncbi:hypothetical protein VPH35_004276 [Triticum aestivum]
MPSASSASSSHSSAAATLGPLSLSSDVASPPMYVRHRPSASSYLSPSRRCSRPQGEKAIKARFHQKGKKIPIPSGVSYAPLPAYYSSRKYILHPRRRRIARIAEMPCRRPWWGWSNEAGDPGDGCLMGRGEVDNTDKEQRCHMDLQGGIFEGWLVSIFVLVCPTYRFHRPSTFCGKKEKGFQQLQSGQSSNCISNIYCTVDHRVKNSSLEKYLYHALCNDSYPNAKNNRFLFAVEISEEIYGRFVYHFQFIFAGSAETARLGQAKEETERDSRASCQTEADFQGSSLRAFDHLYSWHFNFQTSSDSGANVKRLEQETNIKIEQLKQQMLEHASVFLTRIAESFASSPEKLDQLCNHG